MGFANVTKIPKITITARITKIIQGSDTDRYNKSLKESRERGFTNVTTIPNIKITAENNEYNKSRKQYWQI